MRTTMTLFWLLFLATPALVAEVPSKADQIAASVLASPEERRAEVTVLGYDSHSKLIVLRKGSNDLTCLADTPGDENFSVACYHNDLEPFMARGRELSAQGYKGKERHEIRWKEVDNGSIEMPRKPRMLYVLRGKGFDSASGNVIEPYLRWVVYTPYATPESTGLSTASGKSPWLMFPGTAGAHIMISPQ
ncbi:MAG: hypothetical protein CMN58_03630 [Solibacterales bacterium]|nr:hypothetical protein [Bryobacterales bacterium]